MQIDWITVIAQIVNFLVLIWLLKRFLYGPITRAMERREQRIERRLEEAEETRREAEQRAEALRAEEEALARRQDELMEGARRRAEMLHGQLVSEARQEIEEQRQAWRRQLDEERQTFLSDFRQSAARYVLDLARSVLKQLADADLEAQAAKRFADRLSELDEKSVRELAAVADGGEASVLIESPFELSGAIKSQLTRTVHDVIADGLEVSFERASDLLLGVRLRVGGRTVEWTLADYVDRLETNLAEALSRMGPTDRRDVA